MACQDFQHKSILIPTWKYQELNFGPFACKADSLTMSHSPSLSLPVAKIGGPASFYNISWVTFQMIGVLEAGCDVFLWLPRTFPTNTTPYFDNNQLALADPSFNRFVYRQSLLGEINQQGNLGRSFALQARFHLKAAPQKVPPFTERDLLWHVPLLELRNGLRRAEK